jgi:hypothetical protein
MPLGIGDFLKGQKMTDLREITMHVIQHTFYQKLKVSYHIIKIYTWNTNIFSSFECLSKAATNIHQEQPIYSII